MRNANSVSASGLETLTDDRRIKLLHQVHILYNLLPTTQWIHLAAILVVFGLLFKHLDKSLLTAWLGFVFLILSSRILINNYYRRSTKTLDNADYWFNWFLVGTTLYGIMWSATAILLVPAHDPVIVGFTALILSGLAAGGVAVSSVSSKVFLVYAISTMLPYAAFLISSGQNPHSSIGLLILLFFFLISILAYHVNSFFTNLIDLQLKTYALEKEVKQESEKRRFIEKALLDNTMEEGVADLIRQHSGLLKQKQAEYAEARANEPPGSRADEESTENQLLHYVELLNETVLSNVKSALVFLKNVETGVLNEGQKTNMQIVEKILHEARSAIERSFGTGDADAVTRALASGRNQQERINLRRLLIYVTHEIPLLYKAKYITIRRKIDKQVPHEIYGNKQVVEQIFRQLLMNAYKYSDGGTITITVDCLWQEENRIQLRLEVSDTGVGIPKDIIRKLEDDEAPDSIEGGLDIVKQLVTRIGGELSVQSTLGVGSTVTVDLIFNKVATGEALENQAVL